MIVTTTADTDHLHRLVLRLRTQTKKAVPGTLETKGRAKARVKWIRLLVRTVGKESVTRSAALTNTGFGTSTACAGSTTHVERAGAKLWTQLHVKGHAALLATRRSWGDVGQLRLPPLQRLHRSPVTSKKSHASKEKRKKKVKKTSPSPSPRPARGRDKRPPPSSDGEDERRRPRKEPLVVTHQGRQFLLQPL